MARECIEGGHCPRIQQILESAKSRNIMSVGVGFSPDLVMGSSTQRLLEACAATYQCPGPQQADVQVDRGFIRSKIVTEKQWVCGLDKTRG